ncbi:hypothetical protein EGK_17551 [Macaca mulatta]|uniref:Uncharacterized protein n=1 Tax=Macaca mulatta TaxID=9544 RepID=G7MXL1_MACMU|nr:hypothetical protein EGK_17551 [Macaca mulatta]
MQPDNATTQHTQVLLEGIVSGTYSTRAIYVYFGVHFSRTSSLPNNTNTSVHSSLIFWKDRSFHYETQEFWPKLSQSFTDSKNPSFPTRHLKPQLLETPSFPRLHELREQNMQPRALLLSPPKSRKRLEAQAGRRPRGDHRQGPDPDPRTKAPHLPQGVSSRAPRSTQASPGAGRTLCTQRPAPGRRQAHGSG